MKKIGFIGIGVMGAPMAGHLLKAGYSVAVYARRKEAADALVSQGAEFCSSIAQCARGRDAVITMVGFPKDVEEVYFGEQGILQNASTGTILIDMTTTSPRLSRRVAQAAAKKGLCALDAPVSGGDVGARQATLSIMVGGDPAVYQACLPLFQAMGKQVVYEGPAGSGQHTKMANQIALGGAIAGVCEALAYGKRAGLDLPTMLQSISAGAAGSWQMSNMAPRMLVSDFAPGFFIKHYIKDMDIALQEAEGFGLHMQVLEEVRKMYVALAQEGKENLGTQALYQYYEQQEK